jgi:hypothetical protein
MRVQSLIGGFVLSVAITTRWALGDQTSAISLRLISLTGPAPLDGRIPARPLLLTFSHRTKAGAQDYAR